MRRRCLFFLAIALMGAGETAADSVRGIRPAIVRPIAPRGGFMMLPLTAQRPGSDWPRTMTVRLADDRKINADVVWVSLESSASIGRNWTDDPRRLSVRAIARDDDSSAALDSSAGEGPYLVLRVPPDGSGELKIEGETIAPVWVDAHAAALPEGAPQLPMEQAPDRPDVESPFEYWRWVLLADRLELAPPPPSSEGVARAVAQHYADLWRIGMARLRRLSPRIADECRSMLTRTAVDRHRTVATWIADPSAAAMLLGMLLDFSRPDEQALRSAVTWLEQQPMFMVWPENFSGVDVQVAITSLRDDAVAVDLSWLGSEPSANRVQLQPGVIAHVSVARLPMIAAPFGSGRRELEPPLQTLRISAGLGASSTVVDMPCGPRVVEARPPGVSFRPLSPPLTLMHAQMNVAPAADPVRGTVAQIRRVGGRWEAFFECARVFEGTTSLDRENVRTFDDLRGVEAVTLILGDDAAEPDLWLTVPERDWPAVVVGEPHPDLQVHKRSFGDRWYCRIVLPEEWFSAAQTNPAYVAFIRSHGDNQELETGPASCPAWRIAPGRVAIDLAYWDDLPVASP